MFFIFFHDDDVDDDDDRGSYDDYNDDGFVAVE